MSSGGFQSIKLILPFRFYKSFNTLIHVLGSAAAVAVGALPASASAAVNRLNMRLIGDTRSAAKVSLLNCAPKIRAAAN